MNYRHIYHAGNFADIVKHLILISILKKLILKEKPFTVLDCFAGTGKYDIDSIQAKKTAESETGIKKILAFDELDEFPSLLGTFINIVKNEHHLNIYPGSPSIIQSMMREEDNLIACELHTEDYALLKERFYKKENISIHHLDAYLAIKAFLPFKTKRGLIFLDPPFEKKDEFNKLLQTFKIIKKRAENICVLVWYPIKEIEIVKEFEQNYQTIGFKEIFKIEFELYNSMLNMNKCGLLIINPPDIKTELDLNLNFLVQKVFLNNAAYRINYF